MRASEEITTNRKISINMLVKHQYAEGTHHQGQLLGQGEGKTWRLVQDTWIGVCVH